MRGLRTDQKRTITLKLEGCARVLVFRFRWHFQVGMLSDNRRDWRCCRSRKVSRRGATPGEWSNRTSAGGIVNGPVHHRCFLIRRSQTRRSWTIVEMMAAVPGWHPRYGHEVRSRGPPEAAQRPLRPHKRRPWKDARRRVEGRGTRVESKRGKRPNPEDRRPLAGAPVGGEHQKMTTEP
jgi:hypothetical protein